MNLPNFCMELHWILTLFGEPVILRLVWFKNILVMVTNWCFVQYFAISKFMVRWSKFNSFLVFLDSFLVFYWFFVAFLKTTYQTSCNLAIDFDIIALSPLMVCFWQEISFLPPMPILIWTFITCGDNLSFSAIFLLVLCLH